jgi:hypothetical protein
VGTDEDDDREKGKGPLKTRKSWQERAAEPHSKVGMKREGKVGTKWEGLRREVRSAQSVGSVRILGDSVDDSQHEDKGDDAQSQSQS